MTVEITTKRKEIPSFPGVYFFKSKTGKILYIGKAANLKQRIASYFRDSTPHTPAKIKMLEEASDIVWEETESEVEALITEAFLIKRHRPPYNILMRDDKNYYFVGFTKEPFPKLFLTHQPFTAVQIKSAKFKIQNYSSKLNVEYIGPFTDGTSIKRILRMLRRAFPYCTCTEKHNRPCQNAGINLCIRDCCLKNPENIEEAKKLYRKNVASIKKVLTGRHDKLLAELLYEMTTASERREFERAAHLRDQISALERIFAHSRVIKKDFAGQSAKALVELQLLLGLTELPDRIEGYDISNIQGSFAVGSMVVFTNGMPDKDEYRKFKIKTVPGANDPAMMREMLSRRLRHDEWQTPDVILIDGGPTQLNAALKAKELNKDRLEKEPVFISIAKREEELYIPGRRQPLRLKSMPVYLLHLIQHIRDEAHRFAISYYRKSHRRSIRNELTRKTL